MPNRSSNSKVYYYIDIDLSTRQIVGWDTDTKEDVEVYLSNGCYRVFLSKGQFNKLVKKLEAAR